jgi:DNA-binding NtrC family response regulator
MVQRIAQWEEAPRIAAFCGSESSGRRTLAQLAARRLLGDAAPFVVLDGRDAPAEVMHARLFGGIGKQNRATALEQAGGGALFIRQPERLPMAAQAALVRLATDPPTHVQTACPAGIFMAPRDPVHHLVESGRLYPPLAEAAGVNTFLLPALAERPEDVPLLVNYFLRHFERKYQKGRLAFDRAALDLLHEWTWPGNTAQLMNTVEYAVLFGEGPRLGLAALPSEMTADVVAKRSGRLTADVIRTALQQAQGKRMEAAASLGIDRTTLWRAMKRLGIESL